MGEVEPVDQVQAPCAILTVVPILLAVRAVLAEGTVLLLEEIAGKSHRAAWDECGGMNAAGMNAGNTTTRTKTYRVCKNFWTSS